jgi:uncharacterized damage-inducible protein DinB
MSDQPQSEAERMLQYYTTQGERNTFREIWPRAIEARMNLLECLRKVSDDEGAWAPSKDDWSVKEVAHHILNSSRAVNRLVKALSAGETGDSSNIDPPRETTDASIGELIEQLRDDGIEWTNVIAGLPPTPPLQPTSPHPMFGELHARAWFLFQRTHDLDHAGQINAIKTAAGYPGAK